MAAARDRLALETPAQALLPDSVELAVTGRPFTLADLATHHAGLPRLPVPFTPALFLDPYAGYTEADLLAYIEAIIATYNLSGRRDNKYKARIKITVHERGLDVFKAEVEEEFANRRRDFHGADREALAIFKDRFAAPAFRNAATDGYDAERARNGAFRSWTDTNLHAHKVEGYASVIVTFKTHGETPGDASADQMRLLADLADQYGHSDLRISHDQNVVLPHVHKSDLPAVYAALKKAGLATANAGLTSDIIASAQ